jgi:hypothetical protein
MVGKAVQKLERQQYQRAEKYLIDGVKGLGSALDPFVECEISGVVVRRNRRGLVGSDMKR